MNGFDRLQEQVKDQEDTALKQTIEYLLSRKDMEQKYLNEEKNVEQMCSFIKKKGQAHAKNGWNFITNEVVFAWAIMYWSLPNNFLKIDAPSPTKKQENNKSNVKQKEETKNNVIPFEQIKQEQEKKETVKQLSLFGGMV